MAVEDDDWKDCLILFGGFAIAFAAAAWIVLRAC